jgi:mRNA interferase HicA
LKRRELIRQLERAGCTLRRSSGGHDIYFNPRTGRSAPVPRHAEIPDSLCRLIRRQLNLNEEPPVE